MSQPSLNALRTFESAARNLSFKKAAAELHVTPTAVSHQIQQLEDLLGVRLFERVGRGLVLTDAAYSCLPMLQDGFESLRLGIERLRKHRGPDILTVNASPSFASLWLFPRLYRFALLYPELDVRVTTHLRQATPARRDEQGELQNLQEWTHNSDIVIAYGSGAYPDLYSEELLPLYVTPLCSPALLDRVNGDRRLLLEQFPRLHDGRGTLYGKQAYWDEWTSQAGIESAVPSSSYVFTHAVLALSAAEDGLGIVVSTPVLAEAALRNRRLVAPFNNWAKLNKSYHVVAAEPISNQKKARLFCEWLRQEARDSTARPPDGARTRAPLHQEA